MRSSVKHFVFINKANAINIMHWTYLNSAISLITLPQTFMCSDLITYGIDHYLEMRDQYYIIIIIIIIKYTRPQLDCFLSLYYFKLP